MLNVHEIRSGRLRQVYGYWQSKMIDGRLPSRAEIDPLEIPKLLPFLFLVDVARDPLRFRFRLVGTQICAWGGRDPTGLYTDDASFGAQGAEITRQYAEVVERGRPVYREQRGAQPARSFMFYEKVILPLSSDGESVEVLLCASDVIAGTPSLRAGEFRVIWGDLV